MRRGVVELGEGVLAVPGGRGVEGGQALAEDHPVPDRLVGLLEDLVGRPLVGTVGEAGVRVGRAQQPDEVRAGGLVERGGRDGVSHGSSWASRT